MIVLIDLFDLGGGITHIKNDILKPVNLLFYLHYVYTDIRKGLFLRGIYVEHTNSLLGGGALQNMFLYTRF